MRKIWVERAEVERYIVRDAEEAKDLYMDEDRGVKIGEAEYDELMQMRKVYHRFQQELERLWVKERKHLYEGGELCR